MTTFDDCATLFASKRSNWTGKIAGNTWLETRFRLLESGSNDERTAYAVRYHATDVVTIFRGGRYAFNTGGWATLTTADRMNRHCPEGWHVSRSKGEMRLWCSGYVAGRWALIAEYAISGDRWAMIPDATAPGGYRVVGDSVERCRDIVLRRIGGIVHAIMRDGSDRYVDALSGVEFDPTDGRGVRSGSVDGRAVLSDLAVAGIRPTIRRGI